MYFSVLTVEALLGHRVACFEPLGYFHVFCTGLVIRDEAHTAGANAILYSDSQNTKYSFRLTHVWYEVVLGRNVTFIMSSFPLTII